MTYQVKERIKNKLLLVPVTIAAIMVGSCSDFSTIEDLNSQGILVMGNGSEIVGLDPHIVTGVPENRVLQALCEGLLTYHPAGEAPLPGVAQSWHVSEDNLIYTFHLHPQARWWNGDQVTANDFVKSWERMLTPALGSQYQEMLFDIEGAEDFYNREIKDFNQVGVRALNPTTLQVTLRSPAAYFLYLLPHYATFPVHLPTVEMYGSATDRNNTWTKAKNFVCNGPYTLDKWVINDRIVVKKNPNYWDADNVRINEIRFLPIDNQQTEEKAFRQGRIHITAGLPLELVPDYVKRSPPELRIEPYMGTYFYRLNTDKPPLDDRDVRLALSLAIDRQSLVDNVTRGGEQPAHSFTPPGDGYFPDTRLEFDPVLARSILQSKFPNIETMPELELLYNTSEGHRKIAEAIQEMWREHLGITVTLVNQDWKVYLERQRTGNFEISRAGWIGDYPDPLTFLNIMVSGRGNNNTGFANSTYDSILEESAKVSADVRLEFLKAAEQILMSELPVIPLYIYTSKTLVHPSVKGWEGNLLDNHPPKFLWLEKPETESDISDISDI